MHVLDLMIPINKMNIRRQVNYAMVVAVLRFLSVDAKIFSRLSVVSVITKRGLLSKGVTEAADEDDAVC